MFKEVVLFALLGLAQSQCAVDYTEWCDWTQISKNWQTVRDRSDGAITSKTDILDTVCAPEVQFAACNGAELLQYGVLADAVTPEQKAEWDEIVEELLTREDESGIDRTWEFEAEVTMEDLWDVHATLGWWCAGIAEVGTAEDDEGFSAICKDQAAINALAQGLAAAITVVDSGNTSAEILIDASTPEDLEQ